MNDHKKNSGLMARDVKIVNVDELGEEFKKPELIVVRLKNHYRVAPLDFGSFAYSEREAKLSTHRCGACRVVRVNPETLLEHRKDVLLFIFDRIFCKSVGSVTLHAHYLSYRELFYWLDSNGHQNAFLDSQSAGVAYRAYTKSLISKIQSGLIRDSTAAARQSFFRTHLTEYFLQGYQDTVQGVELIKSSRSRHRVPEDAEVKFSIEIIYAAAMSLGKFILDNGTFPFLIKTENFQRYIFPFVYQTSVMRDMKLRCLANSDTGEFRGIDYVLQKFPELNNKRARDLLRLANATIEKNNSDERSSARLRIASLALVSHIVLLQIITGISTSELKEIKYSDLVDSRSGNLIGELRSTKKRAAGRKTRYPLGSNVGRKILQSYMQLRAWVLNGQEFEYAFIHMGRDGTYTGTIKRIRESYSYDANRRLKVLFGSSEVSFIGASLARKYKSLIFHELGIPIGTTSNLLNHTVSTNSVYYAETTQERSEAELARYWSSVRDYASKKMQFNKRLYKAASPIGAGRCNNFDSPIPITGSPPIKPNCAKQFGCLYCEQYLFHADEEDLHKLLSFQYVIGEIRKNFSDLNFSSSLLRDLDVRIKQIVEQSAALSPKLKMIVNDIKSKVFDRGDLTLYWENMLTRLEKIWGVSS